MTSFQNQSYIDDVSSRLIIALTMNAQQPERHQMFENKFQRNGGNIAATAMDMNMRLGDASQQAIASKLVSTRDPRVEAYGAAMDGVLGETPTFSSVAALAMAKESLPLDRLLKTSTDVLNRAHMNAIQNNDSTGAARFIASKIALEQSDKNSLPKTFGMVMPNLEDAGLRMLKQKDTGSLIHARTAFSLVRQASDLMETGLERNPKAMQR